MPIDRRITNGLAWTGALLVIAIPAADIAMRQFRPDDTAQAVVVEPAVTPGETEAVEPSLPTPTAQRPQTAPQTKTPDSATDSTAAAPMPAPPAAEGRPAPDRVATAREQGSGDPVDTFLESGRPLPSYITDGGTASAGATANEPDSGSTSAPVIAAPAATTSAPSVTTGAPATPAPESVASAPRTRIVAFPTPVSERPPPVPREQVASQPPLIIDQTSPVPPAPISQEPIITADDLADWESGPLSEFLARRQGQSVDVTSDYDPDGFFLDEGPNSSARYQRFPRAYEDGYYPFR